MSSTMEPEASRKFNKLVLEAVGADARQVIDGSISVSIDSSSDTARVTWQGVATLPVETVQRLLADAQRLASDWQPLDEKDEEWRP